MARNAPLVRQVALAVSLATVVMAAILLCNFAPGDDSFALRSFAWLGESSGVDIRFEVALDGLSVWLFGLSALLLLVCVLVSWDAVTDRPAAYYALLLLLGTGMLGVFAARDIILFYIFFEFTLIPLFFLIGVWGHEDRQYAAAKFFVYTLAGSMLTFLGLLAIVLWDYYHSGDGRMTFSIPQLTAGLAAHPIAAPYQLWVFLALFAGFAIKVPLFPLHTWLPLAHTQAPSAGSILLAGVLLKIGSYGFLRFSVPMLPEATATCVPWLLTLSVAGIIYGALVALAQIRHEAVDRLLQRQPLGLLHAGAVRLEWVGRRRGRAAIDQPRPVDRRAVCRGGHGLRALSHARDQPALGAGAHHACAGVLLRAVHALQHRPAGPERVCRRVSDSDRHVPARLGPAPAAEGLAHLYKVLAVVAVFGVVLGAWYMLWLVQRVFFGAPRNADPAHAHAAPRDLSRLEVAALVPLAVFVFWIGLHPEFFLSRIRPAIDPLTRPAAEALAELESSALPAVADRSLLQPGDSPRVD